MQFQQHLILARNHVGLGQQANRLTQPQRALDHPPGQRGTQLVGTRRGAGCGGRRGARSLQLVQPGERRLTLRLGRLRACLWNDPLGEQLAIARGLRGGHPVAAACRRQFGSQRHRLATLDARQRLMAGHQLTFAYQHGSDHAGKRRGDHGAAFQRCPHVGRQVVQRHADGLFEPARMQVQRLPLRGTQHDGLAARMQRRQHDEARDSQQQATHVIPRMDGHMADHHPQASFEGA